MAKKDATVAKVMDEHRARLVRVAERRGVERVRDLYDDVVSDVTKRIRSLASTGRANTMTMYQQRLILAQVKQGATMLGRKVQGEMSDISTEAMTDAVQGVAKDLRVLTKQFRGSEVVVPVDEAMTLRSLVGRRKKQLDTMHAESLASWGREAFESVHTSLSKSIAMGRTTAEATDALMAEDGMVDMSWYRGERIVRTETAYAFNAGHADGIQASKEYIPEVRKRWVEYVDEETGDALDDRVADDSLALHGQVVDPVGLFVMPRDPNVDEEMWGELWAFPPNRPNDRAVVHPWFPGMEVIAWELRRGRRVDLT